MHKTLCDQFTVSTLSGFGLDPLPLAKAAAAALIHYAKETQKLHYPIFAQSNLNKVPTLLRSTQLRAAT